MSGFADDPILIYVQTPYTKEMEAFGTALLQALLNARMQVKISFVNFAGGCLSGGFWDKLLRFGQIC